LQVQGADRNISPAVQGPARHFPQRSRKR
jgi:hypothetical protein